MNIYGITITLPPKPEPIDLRHDWLLKQYADCQAVTDKTIKELRGY